MNMFKKLTLAASLLLAGSTSIFAGSESWETNWKKAQSTAIESK